MKTVRAYMVCVHPYSTAEYVDQENALGPPDSALISSVPEDPPSAWWDYVNDLCWYDGSFTIQVYNNTYTFADIVARSGVVDLDPTGVTAALLRGATQAANLNVGYDGGTNASDQFLGLCHMASPYGGSVAEWQFLRDGDSIDARRRGFDGLTVDLDTGAVSFDATWQEIDVVYEDSTVSDTVPTYVDPAGEALTVNGAAFCDHLGTARVLSATFDGDPCADFVVASDSVITLTTPAVTAGTHDLIFTRDDDSTFTYSLQAGAGSAPTITSAENVDVAENTTAVTIVTADGTPAPTFALAGGDDQSLFTINASTGALALLAPPDFDVPGDADEDNVYDVAVRAGNSEGDDFQTLAVTVTNVNEPPTDISLSANTVAENASIGTDVGEFSTTDPDAGDTFTYSLVSGTGSTDNAAFTISNGTLQTAAAINFEAGATRSIRVRSTDQGGLTFDKTFTITVTDVNEAPTDILIDNSTVRAGQVSGTLVGNLTATDVDAGDTTSYALISGTGSTNNSSFAISGSQLVTADVLSSGTLSCRIRVTDSGSLTYDEAFEIVVLPSGPPVTKSSRWRYRPRTRIV